MKLYTDYATLRSPLGIPEHMRKNFSPLTYSPDGDPYSINRIQPYFLKGSGSYLFNSISSL